LSPLFVTMLSARSRSSTVVARMPSSSPLVTATRVRLAPPGTLVSETPAPVEF
jgi:hypothetical protein